MDYMAILRRAWEITKRYKVLWLFGLLAGGLGGSGGGGNGGSGGGDVERQFSEQFPDAGRFIEENVALLAIIILAVVVVLVVLWVLSVAARGGIAYLSREAAEGRPVRGMDGWAVGFRFFWRVLGMSILLALPALALVPFVTFAALTCVLLPAAILVGIALGFAVGIVGMLAVRYAVLEDTPAIDSLKAAIEDLRMRWRDCLVMYLLSAVVNFVGVIVALLAAGVLAIPAILLAIGEQWVVAAVLSVLPIAGLMLAVAVLAAFFHVTWTLFYLQLRSERAASLVAGPPPPPAYAPPPPPAAPGPEATTPPPPPAE